jgi:hypothetical protein
MTRQTAQNIVLIWLLWAVVLIGYMQISGYRYRPNRPDHALGWSAQETTIRSNNNKPYLLDPFLNTQVAWDSEFYLAIATGGYDDPDIAPVVVGDESYSKSYAFFPFYPFLISVLRVPFTALNLTPIAASTLAGVMISLLGTLAAMFALYNIVKDELGESGGIRTAFFMLIFPTSVFLAVVYTEGLFLGLAFSSLALMRRDKLILAAVLAALATWTRAVGGVLLVSLLFTWWRMYRSAEGEADKRQLYMRLPLVFLPVGAYGIWHLALGKPFEFVEKHWFGNSLLQLETSIEAWRQILQRATEYPETAVVVAMGLVAILLTLISCFVALRRYPELALFGLITIAIPLTGGWTGTQSTFRYVLAVPTLWILLGRLGKYELFERGWTLLSVLLLGMQAYLFSFDFWVA